jgi:hypothetical protein
MGLRGTVGRIHKIGHPRQTVEGIQTEVRTVTARKGAGGGHKTRETQRVLHNMWGPKTSGYNVPKEPHKPKTQEVLIMLGKIFKRILSGIALVTIVGGPLAYGFAGCMHPSGYVSDKVEWNAFNNIGLPGAGIILIVSFIIGLFADLID